MTNKKKILVVVLLIVAALAIGAYMQWNKPHPKAEDQQAVSINAENLFTAFTTDETKANNTYLNKVLDVNGTVGELSKNQDGKTVAVLTVSDPMGGVQCTFRDDVSLKEGAPVHVKGFCNGYTLVVLLNDCVLSNQ